MRTSGALSTLASRIARSISGNQKNPQTLTASQALTRVVRTPVLRLPVAVLFSAVVQDPWPPLPRPRNPLAPQTQVHAHARGANRRLLRALRWPGLPPQRGEETWMSVALALASPGSRRMAPGQSRRDEDEKPAPSWPRPVGAVSSDLLSPTWTGLPSAHSPTATAAACHRYLRCQRIAMLQVTYRANMVCSGGLLGGSPQPVQSSQPKPRHVPQPAALAP